MTKPLALFDIGGTMLSGDSDGMLIEAQIADNLLNPVVRDQAADILDRYAHQTLFYEAMVGELMTAYAQGLQGAPAEEVQSSTDRFFQKAEFFGYVEPTIDLLSATHEVVLVTGAAQFTAKAVAGRFSVHRYISTQLGVDNGIVNGEVDSLLATSLDKRDAILEFADAEPVTLVGSHGYGDSEGDELLLRTVDYPVCVRPTAGLAEIAINERWPIVRSAEDLASPYGLQVVRLVLASQAS